MVISGSPRKNGKTQVLMKHVFDYVKQKTDAKLINLSEGGIDYYTGDGNVSETTREAAKDITEADIWLTFSPVRSSHASE